MRVSIPRTIKNHQKNFIIALLKRLDGDDELNENFPSFVFAAQILEVIRKRFDKTIRKKNLFSSAISVQQLVSNVTKFVDDCQFRSARASLSLLVVNSITNANRGEAWMLVDVADAWISCGIPQVLVGIVHTLHELLARRHDYNQLVSTVRRDNQKFQCSMSWFLRGRLCYLSKFFSFTSSMTSSLTVRHIATVNFESKRSNVEKCFSITFFKMISTSSRLKGLFDSNR